MPLVTILTPTYNRGGVLYDLYNSLKCQSCKNFEWLIIDDGSTDETEIKVQGLQKEADFAIRYIKKQNGGKHTALNVGIKQIQSELTFIVDSDDTLTIDAVENICLYYQKYKDYQTLCGYAFLRGYPDGKVNGKLFEPDERIATYIQTRILDNDMYADKAEMFYTKCLREFPFPEIDNEKFLGEDVVWIRMAKKYQMVHINKVIYIGSYQDDGLTKNRRKNNIKSPRGCMLRANEFLELKIPLKLKVKCAVQHSVYGRFAGLKQSEIIKDSNSKFLSFMLWLPSWLVYKKWKSNY